MSESNSNEQYKVQCDEMLAQAQEIFQEISELTDMLMGELTLGISKHFDSLNNNENTAAQAKQEQQEQMQQVAQVAGTVLKVAAVAAT